MNRRSLVVSGLLVAGAAVLCFELTHRQPDPMSSASQPPADLVPSEPNASPPKPAAAKHPIVASSTPSEEPVASEATMAESRLTPPPPAAPVAVADTPESTSLPGLTVLENMRTSVRQYASTCGENPVGTNPEITSSLQGENPKHINFLRTDGNRINVKGELVDVWGTPYFFHQISGHEMEIRSAGPDRVMYTGDDLITR